MISILAVIPARGGSKGLPGKNIRPLGGPPLLYYSIAGAQQSRWITHTVVSTDDQAIADVAKTFACQVVDRPAELASDTAPTIEAIRHAVESLAPISFDLVLILQPTSPLRRVESVDRAIDVMLAHPEYDSLMSVEAIEPKLGKIRDNRFYPTYPAGARRQDLEPLYKDCGVVYVLRPQFLFSPNYLGEHIFPLVIDDAGEKVDIDTEADFNLATYYLDQKRGKP